MKRQLMKWHRVLTWFSFIGVMCWALSGVSHPLMAWFGPQAKKMMPPSFQADASVLHQLEGVIDRLPMDEAAIAKVVPSRDGLLLQITEDEKSPRRYFDLESGGELADYDIEQAKWLAEHYLDVPQGRITNVRFRDRFGSDYPRVNRLLPVYEVTANEDGNVLKAFIYTETGVLAALNNNFKAKAQVFFKALHTWNWLDATGVGRVIVVALLMLTLLAMASSGLYLIFAFPSRKIPQTSRRWHRRFAYVLWLPLLGWSASGFYHLLQAEYVQPVSGVRLLDPVQLNRFSVGDNAMIQWQASIDDSIPEKAFINSITLNQAIDDQPLYRLGVVARIDMPMPEREQRNARFSGQPLERSSVYIDAQSGRISSANDNTVARELVLSLNESSNEVVGTPIIEAMTLVTRFGPTYDFRNKRLPVWRVDFNDESKSRYFVDPVTGILVDKNRQIDRMESWSFSLLHKWNFLRPLIGREKRDILIVVVLISTVAISCFGLLMYLVRKRAPVKQKR